MKACLQPKHQIPCRCSPHRDHLRQELIVRKAALAKVKTIEQIEIQAMERVHLHPKAALQKRLCVPDLSSLYRKINQKTKSLLIEYCAKLQRRYIQDFIRIESGIPLSTTCRPGPTDQKPKRYGCIGCRSPNPSPPQATERIPRNQRNGKTQSRSRACKRESSSTTPFSQSRRSFHPT